LSNFKVNFFVVGAAKSGTTWLAKCCEKHPEICVSDPKETYYFCHNNYYKFFRSEDYSKRQLSWYQKKFFEHFSGNKITGDFTPMYLTYPESAQMIYNHNQNAKIIMILRNPVDRLFSLYIELDKNHIIGKNLDEAVQNHPELVDSSNYADQVKRYLDLFGEKNVLVVIYEELKEDPVKTLVQIFDFLEVDSSYRPSVLKEKINPRQVPRVRFIVSFIEYLRKVLNSNKILIKLKDFLILLGFEKLSWIVLNTNFKTIDSEKIKGEQRNKYLDIYRDDINRLSDLIKKDMSNWLA